MCTHPLGWPGFSRHVLSPEVAIDVPEPVPNCAAIDLADKARIQGLIAGKGCRTALFLGKRTILWQLVPISRPQNDWGAIRERHTPCARKKSNSPMPRVR